MIGATIPSDRRDPRYCARVPSRTIIRASFLNVEGRLSGSGKVDLSTQISQNVIDEALKSVEGPKSPVPDAPAAPEVPIAVEGAPPVAPARVAELEHQLAEARAQLKETASELELSQQMSRETLDRLKETHDRMLRAAADLDNYRKRAAREKEDMMRFGNEGLLKEFLPVLDNLDRALDHARGSKDFEVLLKGVEMTRKAFEDTLGKKGVVAFATLGKPFDPKFHEAIQQVETADTPPNTVVREVVRGYTLNDRLMRPALVLVSRPPPASEAAPAPPASAPEGAGTPAAAPAADEAPAEPAAPSPLGPGEGTPGSSGT